MRTNGVEIQTVTESIDACKKFSPRSAESFEAAFISGMRKTFDATLQFVLN